MNPQVVGTEQVIQAQMEVSDETMATQLDYILQQFDADDTPDVAKDDQAESDDEEAEEDEDEGDVDDLMSADAGEGESIPETGEGLSGEALLCSEYLNAPGGGGGRAPTKPAGEAPLRRRPQPSKQHIAVAEPPDMPLSRPTTPSPSRPSTGPARPITGGGRRTATAGSSRPKSSRSRPSSSSQREPFRPSTGRASAGTATSRPSSSRPASQAQARGPVPQLNVVQPPPPSKEAFEKVSERAGGVDMDAEMADFNSAFSTRPKVPRTPAGKA